MLCCVFSTQQNKHHARPGSKHCTYRNVQNKTLRPLTMIVSGLKKSVQSTTLTQMGKHFVGEGGRHQNV